MVVEPGGNLTQLTRGKKKKKLEKDAGTNQNMWPFNKQIYLNLTSLSSLKISKCLEKILKQKAKNIVSTLTGRLHSL